MTRTLQVLTLALTTLCVSAPAFAQVDLAGNWASRMHEDWMDRWPGPDVGDFLGLPLNEDGRTRALSYSGSLLSLPERQCLYYQPHYVVIGPQNLKIWSEWEAVTNTLVAWKISAAIDRAVRTIWMDGRPHPSKTAPHPFGGFSTGRWDGNTLVVTTTHMKAGYVRRNGVPSSENTVTTEFITRHGDTLTITAIIDDPAYLAEPLVISRSWQDDPATNVTPYTNPCVPAIEAPGLVHGDVPHYLPSENPFLTEMTGRYNIPSEAVLGQPHTLYPEYRKTLQSQYKLPPTCTRYCCGWGGQGGNGPGDAPNLKCTARSRDE